MVWTITYSRVDVIVFLSFGYQKWFEYEAQVLIPFISSGPLIPGCTQPTELRASWYLGVKNRQAHGVADDRLFLWQKLARTDATSVLHVA